MTLGADRKKLTWLGVVALVGGVLVYFNSGSSDPTPVRTVPTVDKTATPAIAEAPRPPLQRRVARNETREFTPVYGTPVGQTPKDPSTIDPTLRLDLLAKVQKVEANGAGRNLFQFGNTPPADSGAMPKVPNIHISQGPVQGPELPPKPPPPPPKPTAPVITMKYYGFATPKAGHKRAFFLDGDEIIVAAEGETIKRRYRIVKIGVNSVVMEDTDFKSQQTIPLTEDVPS